MLQALSFSGRWNDSPLEWFIAFIHEGAQLAVLDTAPGGTQGIIHREVLSTPVP